MSHPHRWALTHITHGPTPTAHFVCTAPGMCAADPLTTPADSYLAARAAVDAGVPGPWPPLFPAYLLTPLPAVWPAPVFSDPERL